MTLKFWTVKCDSCLTLHTGTRRHLLLALALDPAVPGLAVDFLVALAFLALFALQLAALGEMGVLVVGVARGAFPQFGLVI